MYKINEIFSTAPIILKHIKNSNFLDLYINNN